MGATRKWRRSVPCCITRRLNTATTHTSVSLLVPDEEPPWNLSRRPPVLVSGPNSSTPDPRWGVPRTAPGVALRSPRPTDVAAPMGLVFFRTGTAVPGRPRGNRRAAAPGPTASRPSAPSSPNALRAPQGGPRALPQNRPLGNPPAPPQGAHRAPAPLGIPPASTLYPRPLPLPEVEL